MPIFLIAFLLFFLPLVILPFGISPFEIPKVILAELAIEAWLFYSLIKKEKLDFLSPKYRLFLVLFALTLIHLVFLRTETSFFGNTFRLQGIFLLWHMIIFCVLSAPIKFNLNPRLLYLSGIGLTLSVLILGDNGTGRLIGTLGEPNALSAAVIFLWPFIFFISKLPLKILTVFLSIFIIFVSGSRSGLVAFFIQGLFLTLSQRFKVDLVKTTVVGLVLLLLSFSLPLIEGGGWYENRAEIWQAAWVAGWESPVFGNGFGNVEKMLPIGSKIVGNNARFQYVDSSHNIFLDWWIQGGIIGILILGFLLQKTFNSFISKSKKLELTVLLGLLVVLSFNPVSVVALVQFWWLLGQGFGDAQKGD